MLYRLFFYSDQSLPAVGAETFFSFEDIATCLAGSRLKAAERRAAGNTGGFADRVGGAAELTSEARKAFRDLGGGAPGTYDCGNHLPNPLGHRQVGNILGKVIQAVEQVDGVEQGHQGGLPQAGSNAQPLEFTHLHHDTVFMFLDVDGHGSLATRAGELRRGDLEHEVVAFTQQLGTQVALVEFSHERLGDIGRSDIPVKDASFHRL